MKLKGNPIGWMFAVLVAATSLWFGSTSWRSSKFEDNSTILLSKKEKENFKAPPIEYPTIRFTTVGATEQSYRGFIAELRTHLRTNDERYGIPVLRNRDEVNINQRFLLIELTNPDGQIVTLAMDVTSAYIVGYRAGNNAYFLRPDNQEISDAITRLFEGDEITRQTFDFDGSYGRLVREASRHGRGPTRDRENIELGIGPLEEAISALYLYTTGGETRIWLVAESFIISIQMIAEAVRFQYIEHEIARRIRLNQRTAPDASVVELENNWGALSTAIQESDQGTFAHNVQLQRRGGRAEDLFEVDNVMTVIRIIALMSYSCTPRRQFRSPLLLMPDTSNFDNNICVEHEPTVRISGRNGFCVDVSNGRYNNGNSIILWQCKSNADENQLWTLKRDGTIQSNGKCLTTYGYSTGCYLMIYDCSTAVTDATRWQVWENGTIINPISGLVLAATSGDKGTTLSVETNVYAASQAWLPSMNTQPFVTSIVGLNDLCLQVNGEIVWLEECANGKGEQQWALYPDSSIRPQQNQDNCLTGIANVQDGIVRIHSCSSGSSSQRWMFKNDGSIWNLNSKLVLDVRSSDPSLKQIIMYTFTGNPNQQWLPFL